MNRKQFAVIAVFTAMGHIFNEATMAGQMLFCMFWALLILPANLQTTHLMVEKIASAIEKKSEERKTFGKESFFKVFHV